MNANPAHMFFCGSIPLEHEVDVFNALAMAASGCGAFPTASSATAGCG